MIVPDFRPASSPKLSMEGNGTVVGHMARLQDYTQVFRVLLFAGMVLPPAFRGGTAFCRGRVKRETAGVCVVCAALYLAHRLLLACMMRLRPCGLIRCFCGAIDFALDFIDIAK